MKMKILLIAFALVSIENAAHTQSLPNVQKQSLRAPANIKIDGKANEWGDKMQAYNNATEISYSISNDDNNLYLTVQATNHTIINKILGGGLTLTINTADKKDLKNAISVSYPLLDIHNRLWVDVTNKPVIISGDNASIQEADSVMSSNNKLLTSKAKFIMVTGIKELDTLTSVYNNDGIKAVALFNNQMVYTYELSVNLKLIGLNTTNLVKFKYNIKLAGVDVYGLYKQSGIIVLPNKNGAPRPTISMPKGFDMKNFPSLPSKISIPTFTSATDFWGEYKLAK